MRSKLFLLVALLGLLSVGCPSRVDVESPSSAPLTPPDTELCGEMCEHIGAKGLNCEEGQAVYDSDLPGEKDVPNLSCNEFCKTSQDRGSFINPRCVLLVKTCDEIESARKKTPDSCKE